MSAAAGGASETETEPDDETCRAGEVLYGGGAAAGARLRRLAEKPCRDVQEGDPTQLLEDDATASGLHHEDAEDGLVKLCRHHRRVYQAERGMHICSEVVCRKYGGAVAGGARVCEDHAREACRLGALRGIRGEGSGRNPAEAEQGVRAPAARGPPPTPAEVPPSGEVDESLVALVKGLRPEGYYRYVAEFTQGGCYVEGQGWDVETPQAFCPVRERGLVEEAMESGAPVILVEGPAGGEVLRAAAGPMPEPEMKRLEIRARCGKLRHPLARVSLHIVADEREAVEAGGAEDLLQALRGAEPAGSDELTRDGLERIIEEEARRADPEPPEPPRRRRRPGPRRR